MDRLATEPRYLGKTLLLFFAGVFASLYAYFSKLDERLAHAFAENISRMAPFGHGLGSAVLVAAEMLVITFLVGFRVVYGRLPDLGKVVLVACTSSIVIFAVNDFALKILFGVPNPGQFLFDGIAHRFNFFHGTVNSSFPSGHMAMATAFAAVIVRLYPRTTMLFAILLAMAGMMLVFGDWHFLSDVFSGAVVGTIGGLAAGELWLQHTKRHLP